MKTIFIVEDEKSIQELYQAALKSASLCCRCFCDGNELFETLEKEKPDLFILDIMLQGMDGYEILSELKKNSATAGIPVIMVSAKNEEISVVKGFDLGADDYIKKPFGIMELIARVNSKLKTVSKESVEYRDIVVDGEKHIITANGKPLKLTLKEYNLLLTLILNAEKILDRNRLLDKIWGEEYCGETRTLDIHIAEIRKKLAEAKSAAVVVTVRGVGYGLR